MTAHHYAGTISKFEGRPRRVGHTRRSREAVGALVELEAIGAGELKGYSQVRAA